MKNKKLLTLGMAVVLTLSSTLTGCGKTEDADTAVEATEVSTTEKLGQVTEIDGSTITLQLGTIEEPSGGANGDGGEAPADNSDGSAPSDGSNGSTPSDSGDGSAPEKADGDGGNGGSAPTDNGSANGGNGGEAPTDNGNGSAPSGSGDGSAPEKPDGDGGNGGSAPADNGSANGNGGEAPADNGNGSAPSDSGDGSAPEKPDENSSDNSTSEGSTSDDENGASNSDGGEAPGEMDFSQFFTAGEETYTFEITDESVLDGISLSDIEEGDILVVTVDADDTLVKVAEYSGGQKMADGQGMPGGQSSGDVTYTAVTTYTEDTETDGESYTSEGTDEEAVLVDEGATVTLNNATVTRTSADSTGGDNSSFYGVGAALLAKNGILNINGGTITTDAAGGAGVFAYGDGVVNISDATIRTTQDTSGGIHVAGGGTLTASNLDVETNGASSAAIRSDRGGGTMTVNGGKYVSNGSGSPAVYCTANIDVSDATLEATGSEAVCIEGLNSLTLNNVDLTGNMPDNEQNDNTWTVILYQSMSGDSEVGNSVFTMNGGSITSKNGGMFYTTNTECEFYLSGVTLNYSDDDDFLLQCTGNTNQRGWGTAGANGSNCTFTGDSQTLQGTVLYDSISTLDFILKNGSTFTGTFVDDETYAGNGGDGYCNVNVDESSTWVVTKDCTITSLSASGKIVDESGKTVTIKGTDGTVYVKGDGSVTVTVSSYEG